MLVVIDPTSIHHRADEGINWPDVTMQHGF
jgi:hypothetical protein